MTDLSIDATIVSLTLLSLISAIACSVLLCHLYALNARCRERLFWRQLVTLAIVDLLWALVGVFSPAFILQDQGFSRRPVCQGYLATRDFLEFMACIIEVQMAAGIAAASCRWAHTAAALRWMLIPNLILSTLLIYIAYLVDEDGAEQDPTAEKAHSPGTVQCTRGKEPIWGGVVLFCCALALILYSFGVVGTVSAPSPVRRRVLLCMLGYMASFLSTFGVRALENLFFSSSDIGWHITYGLLCLNGAFNVCTYAVYMKRARSRGNSSFRVGFRSTEVMPYACESFPTDSPASILLSHLFFCEVSLTGDLVEPDVLSPTPMMSSRELPSVPTHPP